METLAHSGIKDSFVQVYFNIYLDLADEISITRLPNFKSYAKLTDLCSLVLKKNIILANKIDLQSILVFEIVLIFTVKISLFNFV